MARLVLTNARLLDGKHPAVDAMNVVVADGRIAEVTASAPNAIPGDEVVDLAGRTVMPGMYTCHFHSTFHDIGAQPNVPFGDQVSPSYTALIAAHNAQIALRLGYTGIVSAGAAHDVEPGVKRAIEDGLIVGPRMWTGSRRMSTTGHWHDRTPWWWGMHGSGGMRLCDGPEGFRIGVREEVKRGAEIIKLDVTGGHGTNSPKERIELTKDELAAAIETAHQCGVLIRGHLANKKAIMWALEYGMDIIDHCDDLDDDVIAAVLETGAFVVPSLYFVLHFLKKYEARLSKEEAAAVRGDFDAMCETIPKAQAAGVKFVLGDDYGSVGFSHGTYGGEMHLYVENAGLSPLDVIGWATRNGAEIVRRGNDLGTVEVGKLADLLVVEGDPSADIGAIADHEPLAVLKEGVLVHGSLDLTASARA